MTTKTDYLRMSGAGEMGGWGGSGTLLTQGIIKQEPAGGCARDYWLDHKMPGSMEQEPNKSAFGPPLAGVDIGQVPVATGNPANHGNPESQGREMHKLPSPRAREEVRSPELANHYNPCPPPALPTQPCPYPDKRDNRAPLHNSRKDDTDRRVLLPTGQSLCNIYI